MTIEKSPNAPKGLTGYRYDRQKNMKLATAANFPKKTSAKVNDPDNPAWTEEVLGAPVLKRERGPQATPKKVLTSVRLDAERNLARPRVPMRKRVAA